MYGWCHGGTIVFEMVRHLEQRGEAIRSYSAINTFPPNREVFKDAQAFDREGELNVVYEMFDAAELDAIPDFQGIWPAAAAFLQARSDADSVKRRIPELIAEDIPNIDRLDISETIYYFNVIRTFAEARGLYTPPAPINAAMHYFEAVKQRWPNRDNWSEHLNYPPKIHEISGDHFSIYTSPDVEAFAEMFDEVHHSDGLRN